MTGERLLVLRDPDHRGRHSPESRYVAEVWLPVVGPAAWTAWRLLARGANRHPSGWSTNPEHLASMLGLGRPVGHQSALPRALRRLERFSLVRTIGPDVLVVRCELPDVTEHQLERLQPVVRHVHESLSPLPHAGLAS